MRRWGSVGGDDSHTWESRSSRSGGCGTVPHSSYEVESVRFGVSVCQGIFHPSYVSIFPSHTFACPLSSGT